MGAMKNEFWKAAKNIIIYLVIIVGLALKLADWQEHFRTGTPTSAVNFIYQEF